MRRTRVWRFLVAAGLSAAAVLGGSAGLVRGAVAAQAPQKPAAASTPAVSADQKQWGFLSQYCTKCHNVEDWAGGVAFDTMSPADIPDQAEIFEHMVAKLRGRLMPPAGKPQPDSAAVHSMVSWLETALDKAAATRPADPGRVALHRLNRKEYANAVWDLLAVHVDPSTVLPADDRSDGFDNVANVLQVSPAFLDQYFASARAIAVQAVGEVPGHATGTQYFVRNAGGQQFHVEGLPLGTRGGMVVEHWFPADGEYELNIGNLAVALWVYNMEFENKLIALLDGKKFWEFTIGGEEQMKSIDQKQDPAVDAINKKLKGIRFHATAGPHKLAVTFVQRTFAESDDKLYQQVPGGGQDRILRLGSFEVRGPFSPTGLSQTPSRQRIFICHPASAQEEKPCATRILALLARDAYRRPVTEADVKLLMGFYAKGRQEKDFDEGIRRGLTAILASPYFLYRAEHLPQLVQAKNGGPAVYRISDLELASRLSFFLWSSTPDEELLGLATAGKLHEPDVLHAQVKRMLADARSETLASNFGFQWLGIDRLAEIAPDPNIFPYAGDPREEYRTELRMFVDSIFREDHNVVDLLTANYTFLNERLALTYGINSVRGDRFRRVQLTDSARFGLLGKGAVLMSTSYPTRTAPVLRGEWILDRITGTPPAAPPPSVPSLKENKSGEVAHTVRELMAQHRDKPSCFACHGLLDPLGFALENFDAVGVWRAKDRIAGSPIDAAGVLPDGTKVGGVDDLRRTLAGNPEQFVQTLTEKLMTYATGRTVTWRDMPTIRAMVRASARDNYRFSSIVRQIVDSDQFQMRSAASEAAHSAQTALNQH
jgi:mono/diheme cytochrome c family protein